MKQCKACGAPILWIRMKTGRSMPVDAEPVTYWKTPVAAGKAVTPTGEIVLGVVFEGELQTVTGVGYRPHWASCPQADSFKRRV